MIEKVVKVSNKGMVSIPADIRRKHKIKDGDYVLITEDVNGTIIIRVIEPVESIREKTMTVEEFKEIYKKSREEDLRLER